MTDWTRFSAEEVERRRLASVEAMAQIEREAFARRYQERCDRTYWTRGQCCAGCDHWRSDAGNTGECAAAGIVSGLDVLRSIVGEGFCSIPTPPPGLPYTDAGFHCGKFSDEFDWSTLDLDYLRRIGAFANGALKTKPKPPATGGYGDATNARDKT